MDVTLISKLHSTSDLDYFHARDLPFSRVKSHDDPILATVEKIVQKGFLYTDRYLVNNAAFGTPLTPLVLHRLFPYHIPFTLSLASLLYLESVLFWIEIWRFEPHKYRCIFALLFSVNVRNEEATPRTDTIFYCVGEFEQIVGLWP